jgi:hypothetical protein
MYILYHNFLKKSKKKKSEKSLTLLAFKDVGFVAKVFVRFCFSAWWGDADY